ncbi:response regulator receiver domain [Hoeflea sp. AS60]|uniref:response regulator receiver domain n=1 Tax=Hoeflea sp. AS60 TaxID=3135780 RepID=UPI0031795F76
MASEHQRDFIKEAFIDPIRSVLIVDDDYPTFEEMADHQIAKNENRREPLGRKKWLDEPARFRRVIDNFRNAHSPLMIDIHDGQNVEFDGETETIGYLNQSDLLVLDFHLDPTDQTDGSRAIKIARKVLGNHHFNLIVVHTRTDDISIAFRQMLKGLLPPAETFLTPDQETEALTLLQAAEEDDREILQKLQESIKDEQYLFFRKCGCKYPPVATTPSDGPFAPSYADFEALCQDLGWQAESISSVALFVMRGHEKKIAAELNPDTKSTLSWSGDGKTWIRSDAGFIAFSRKQDSDDLLDELLKALRAWRPRPSRLFLAKLRAQIEKFGVTAESNALGNNNVLAHWYKRLLDEDGESRDFYIGESLARHTELLLDFIKPEVQEFAGSLVEADANNGQTSNAVCAEYFNVNLADPTTQARARNEHNAFVCSKNVEGFHLTTGHVFKTEDDYWICLSPACDLVPGQKKSPETGTDMPFMAVRLQTAEEPAENAKADRWTRWYKQIQSNRFIFLRINDEHKVFCINSQHEEGSSPRVYPLYAKRGGNFSKGTKNFEFMKPERAANHRLVMKPYPAEVIAQLRYEYALNLLQKLGTSMTRIGLDFIGKFPD